MIKLKASAKILALPAPVGVLEGSRADVSFVAGLLMDKFAWHIPLYRQHQRLGAAGIRVSRPWLTQLVGIIQSLIVTCRLHGIDPYTYLVDVLQRTSENPASRVAELTPRLWNQHFAANSLRSDIHDFPV